MSSVILTHRGSTCQLVKLGCCCWQEIRPVEIIQRTCIFGAVSVLFEIAYTNVHVYELYVLVSSNHGHDTSLFFLYRYVHVHKCTLYLYK